MVLDRILDSIGDSEAASIATFGDGPVEIRETHKRGGITVGIASNELRRYGLNQSKTYQADQGRSRYYCSGFLATGIII